MRDKRKAPSVLMGPALDPDIVTSPLVLACDTKKQYASKRAALSAAPHKRLRAYWCKSHTAWHLTSRVKPLK